MRVLKIKFEILKMEFLKNKFGILENLFENGILKIKFGILEFWKFWLKMVFFKNGILENLIEDGILKIGILDGILKNWNFGILENLFENGILNFKFGILENYLRMIF